MRKPPIKKPMKCEPYFCECGGHAWAPLTRGFVTLVSVVDAWTLRAKWHAHKSDGTFYAFRTVHVVGSGREAAIRNSEYLHKIILPGHSIVDHKNRNSTDNRRGNLRAATKSQNSVNSAYRGNTCFRGVSFDRSRQKWVAQIGINRRHHHIGRYVDAVTAAKAYDCAALEYYGEFAVLNFQHSCEGDRADPCEPENEEGEHPRGFFAHLTAQQQKAALAYRGPENIGGSCEPEKEQSR